MKLYPQSTPQETLESAIKAAEKGRQDYIAAFLLDPAFVDAEASIRGKAFVAAVEEDLRERRTREKNDSNLPRDKRLPDDPQRFKTFVDAEIQARGFVRFVLDMREKATDDPSQLKELRRFLREGQWEITGEKAKVTVRDIKDRAVFLRKIDNRWFLENRQVEEKPAVVPANP
ncbi:MAG: hypothetical protein U0798_16525 [Gemmataceae bacterium]